MKEFVWPNINSKFDIKKHTILLCVAGSKSYGTDHPLSDTDYKGVIIPPKEYYLSPFKNFEQATWSGKELSGRVSEIAGKPESEEEGTLFGIKKFINLASASNPNVIELLFTDQKHMIHKTKYADQLISNKQLFLSQKACKTFCGYAQSQLSRIETHKRWLQTKNITRPTRAEYNLPEEVMIPKEQQNAAREFIRQHSGEISPWLLEADNQHKESFWESFYLIFELFLKCNNIQYENNCTTWIQAEDQYLNNIGLSLGFDSNFLSYLQNEKKYAQAKLNYQQYESWLKNRNPARFEIESKYGYDTKHAMHLVRLLRMGEEILTTGSFHVYRPDREELTKIRNGFLSYDELIAFSKEKTEKIYSLVKNNQCVVPKEPDTDKIEEIYLSIVEQFWND